MKKLLNNIYWFFYKLTPAGKQAYIFKQGLAGLKQTKAEGNLTKISIIGKANKLLKTKKILAFNKGKSIAKAKKTNHQVIDQVAKTNQEQLNARGLKITNSGKFANA